MIHVSSAIPTSSQDTKPSSPGMIFMTEEQQVILFLSLSFLNKTYLQT